MNPNILNDFLTKVLLICNIPTTININFKIITNNINWTTESNNTAIIYI